MLNRRQFLTRSAALFAALGRKSWAATADSVSDAPETADINFGMIALTAAALITATVRPGEIFVPMHYVEANRLTHWSVDPHSRQPAYKSCAVALTGVRPRKKSSAHARKKPANQRKAQSEPSLLRQSHGAQGRRAPPLKTISKKALM